jgi:hypothetical protein
MAEERLPDLPPTRCICAAASAVRHWSCLSASLLLRSMSCEQVACLLKRCSSYYPTCPAVEQVIFLPPWDYTSLSLRIHMTPLPGGSHDRALGVCVCCFFSRGDYVPQVVPPMHKHGCWLGGRGGICPKVSPVDTRRCGRMMVIILFSIASLNSWSAVSLSLGCS